ncbi:MAG: GNAT family N-acetyltransferase [Bacteroidales bacterium]|nr:GNAT family N-acetyltransferase [Bacteroidales bacterium]
MSLRIAEPEDADQIYDWENDRRVWRVSETTSPVSHFQIEQFLLANVDLSTNKQLRLMIHVEGEDKAVGCVDLFDYDVVHQRVGIGILIDEGHRRQGYATGAVEMAVDYLFNNVMVHQVHCLIDESNTESQRLFERLGFECHGRRKDWIKTPEGYLDTLFYQKLNIPTAQ